MARIALILPRLSRYGGVEQFAFRLAEALAETRNSEVLTFLKSENLPYQITYYDTADAQQQALIDDEVDMISSVSLSPIATVSASGTPMVAAAKRSPSPLLPGTRSPSVTPSRRVCSRAAGFGFTAPRRWWR